MGCCAVSRWLHAGDARAQSTERLGKVNFPSCGIAHWGTAVAHLGNPLAGPPTPRGMQEGAAAVARAKAAGAKSQRELDYIAAIDAFYKDADKVDHRTRALAYEKAMEANAQRYPADREAAIFYALALNVTLNPNDKTYAKQRKAAAVLEKAFAEQPEHPGVAHYLIHSYDFPPIASKGVTAARRYADIAPPRRTRCTCRRTFSRASATGRNRSIPIGGRRRPPGPSCAWRTSRRASTTRCTRWTTSPTRRCSSRATRRRKRSSTRSEG